MKLVTSLIVILVSVVAALQDEKSEEDYNEYPKYNYEYGVHDPITTDIKKHWEKRNGDFVKGSYRFVQPDGSLRIVDYNADGKNGFNAFVKYEDITEHPLETKIEREPYEAPVQSENLQDPFNINFLPEEYTSITPPHAFLVENEENLNVSKKNKSIHAYNGNGKEQGKGNGYEVEENPESNEKLEERD